MSRAAFLASGDHQALLHLVAELRREEETALLVELGCVGAGEHLLLPSPSFREPNQASPPLRTTLPHIPPPSTTFTPFRSPFRHGFAPRTPPRDVRGLHRLVTRSTGLRSARALARVWCHGLHLGQDTARAGWGEVGPQVDQAADRAGMQTSSGADVDEVRAVAERIQGNIAHVIEGKPEIARSALVVLLAGGHLLIEDVPGVGKTMLSKALARSIDCTVRRIQFTPDLLPSDVTGVVGVQPGHPAVRVPARRDLRQHRRRRRDQPRQPEDPGGDARVHGGGPGHRRRDDVRPRVAVHGDRHPEPHRDGGHLRPARGTARPVHGAALDGLPGRVRRDRDALRPRRRQPARGARAGDRRSRGRAS